MSGDADGNVHFVGVPKSAKNVVVVAKALTPVLLRLADFDDKAERVKGFSVHGDQSRQ